MKSLFYKDFLLLHKGYEAREEKEKNRTRHIMAYVKAFGGMGVSETVRLEDIWPLRMDQEFEKRMITDIAGAKELLKEFM